MSQSTSTSHISLKQWLHALIIFEGAWEGEGAVIQYIPKCINYIMKYLDCHLDYDGQSSLIM